MWLSDVKNLALAGAVRTFLNHQFKSLGHITSLKLEGETIELTADLIGEDQPISAKIDYRLEEQPDGLTFVPTRIECSRPWLQTLAATLLQRGTIRLAVPHGLASIGVKLIRT